MRRLFRQFSTPGGVPSHVSVPTPGSIHEGGELGYVLTHACGAAFDNPDLLVVAVVGDGEAETGPLAGSWKGTRYLNPRRDGAVLTILHLNGYKISGPTDLGRTTDDDLRAYLESGAPSAAGGSQNESGAPGETRSVAAQLAPRRALRRRWTAAAGTGGAGADGRAAHGRQPPRQWRQAAG